MRQKMLVFIGLIISLFFSIILAGCVEEQDTNELADSIVLYNWEDYLGENTILWFEEEYGVEVIVETYENEDEMIAALSEPPVEYDVVVASNSVVEYLREGRLITQLDKENIENFDNIDPWFLNHSFDPENLYSIPYLWGTTGVAYNSSKVGSNDLGWDLLWNESFSGKIAMLDAMEETISAGLKYTGHKINNDNLTALQDAETALLQQRPLLYGYIDSERLTNCLINGSIDIALCYSGDTYFASDYNENISYFIPEQGSVVWIDNMVIPATSEKKHTAEVFINYIIEERTIADITNYTWYANTIPSSKPLIDEEITSDDLIYLDDDILHECEFIEGLSSEFYSEYNRIWANLMNMG